jgi:hypothetical protein
VLYTVADRILYFASGLLARVRAALWMRFLRLTIAGKAFALGVVLFLIAWASAKIGLHGLAHEVASAARFVLSVLATFLICRHIFLRFTYRNPYR